MLSLGLKRLYYVCDRVLVRNVRNRRPGPQPNPGVQQRLDALRQQGLRVQEDDAEEFVENSESDFYKAGHAYDANLNETLVGQIEKRHQIVKQKYFKENMPNLLTWSEKEQIRHLNETQPDVWTPEAIAESFPVTVPVVKKLLKYPWKPTTEERIARHDATAMRNWRDLKEGHLEIPEDMRQHFLKFSARTIPPLQKKSLKIDITKDENLGEFEKIIQRCAAKQEAKHSNQAEETNAAHTSKCASNEEYDHSRKKESREKITLDQLTAKIKHRLDTSNDLDMPDQLMLSIMNNKEPDTVNNHQEIEVELFDDDNKQDKLSEYKGDEAKVEHLKSYPERIRIPKRAYKKGATYKVDDCFYDHDGHFLYRVLGMTNKDMTDKGN